MNIFQWIAHLGNGGHHNFTKYVNETIGPRVNDPDNPSGMKYSMIRICSICGRREIYREVAWAKKTSSYGKGEMIEHTPSEWVRLVPIAETIKHRGRKIKVGYTCFSEMKNR